uniref:Retrovirus-related Pol polyprotein from transposon TNT 1-94 n=1 Tax=Lactuca sativa TaxID=4236 RepID=A0A9R1UGU2_LACSA|nr:hypothetical protein LSAT_V11C900460910 [Lactuca sativa]
MKVLLGSKDIWDIIEDVYIESTDVVVEEALTDAQKMKLKDSRKRDKKYLFLIFQGVDESAFEKISGIEESLGGSTEIALRSRKGKKREALDEVRVMEILLCSLVKNFDYVVTSIDESKDLSLISMDELVGSLQAHEQRMNQNDVTSNLDQAIQDKNTSLLSFI